jgi:group I intron endonuclease
MRTKYPGSGIYQIRCLDNFKVYVGSAVSLRKRKVAHWKQLRNGSHVNRILQNSWNKHGEDRFVFEVLEAVFNKEDLVEREQSWLGQLIDADRRSAYNICPVAGSHLGLKYSPESCAKISASHKGRRHSPEAMDAQRNGIAERKERLGGRFRTPEHDAALAAARAIPGAEEKRIAAVRAANAGRKLSAETRSKISAANKGRKPHPNTSKAVSESNKRRGGPRLTHEIRVKAWETRRRNAEVSKTTLPSSPS